MSLKRGLYFDCFSGISGDMILGALVSFGVDIKEIRKGLKLLKLTGYKLVSRQVERNGFIGTKVPLNVWSFSIKIPPTFSG